MFDSRCALMKRITGCIQSCSNQAQPGFPRTFNKVEHDQALLFVITQAMEVSLKWMFLMEGMTTNPLLCSGESPAFAGCIEPKEINRS